MKHFDFVIAGAGSSGRTAAETLVSEAPRKSILLIDAEDRLPYKRTSVSKNVLSGYEPDAFAVHKAEWYLENGVELLKGNELLRVDADARTISLVSDTFSYSALLLATGARPCLPFTNLPPGKWSALWTVRDGLILHEKLQGLKKIAVLGTGVLGVEAAWQVSQAGIQTLMVGRDKWPMIKTLDRQSSESLEHAVRDASVSLLLEREILTLTDHPESGGLLIKTDNETISADYAVLAVGGEPEVSLARSSGINAARGILVDSGLKTSAPDVWAAGDCAEHPDGLITGLWHSAEYQGRQAALGMLGRPVRYENPPYRLKCEVFGGYWFSAGPVNAPDGSNGLEPAESLDSGGILWRPRFRNGKLAALAAAAPSGMDKVTARTAQKLLLDGVSREEALSVLSGKSL